MSGLHATTAKMSGQNAPIFGAIFLIQFIKINMPGEDRAYYIKRYKQTLSASIHKNLLK